jgi:hypothetical protein
LGPWGGCAGVDRKTRWTARIVSAELCSENGIQSLHGGRIVGHQGPEAIAVGSLLCVELAHATIEWDDKFFAEMLNSRIRYFSDGARVFADLFEKNVDVETATKLIISISMRSPRELVRLMTIIVEHDIQYAGAENHPLLSQQSIEDGLDKYVKERITAVYPDKTLGQIFRLSETKFVNKDVQNAFRVNAQSARTKIKNWEDAGLVKQIGTRAPEGDQGGKPSNEYAIIDARVERIITRRLIHLEDDIASEEDVLTEE